ncbi:MAG: DUF3857 domain-containing protein, partial [Kiritimatiellia bacterium]
MRRIIRCSLAMYVALLPLSAIAAGGTAITNGLLDRSAVLANAAAITTEVYPDAEDVILASYTRVRYNADGTSEQWDDEYIKVLTEKGKRSRRTFSLYFTLPYESDEVQLAEVIKPDGTAIPVDVKTHSRIMVDPSQMSANIYNPNQKILRLSVPELEVGDICHVISRSVVVKARVPNTWSDYTLFEYTSPIKYLVYEVIGPKELPLRKIAHRDEIPNTVDFTQEEKDNTIRYLWVVRDVPRMFEEPNMPPLYSVVQRVLVSTVPDWREISRWYWNLCRPHLEAVTPEMKRKVAELTAGESAVTGRIERIFQFVSQQIRYMGITTEEEAPGYEPHDVKITFENRYGVCRDKAALLVAMLRLADIPAYPVLIHTGWPKDEEVPQPFFNHAIVAVGHSDGSYLLMDPTDENTRELLPAYLCDKSYLVAHPDGEALHRSPIQSASRNLMRITTRGRIDEDGTLEATTRLSFEGINDNAYRSYFSRAKPIERRRLFEGRVKDVAPGAKLLEFALEPSDLQDTSKPLAVSLKFRAPDYIVRGEDCCLIPPLWLSSVIGYVNWVLGETGLEKRKYPLYTHVACGAEETFELDLGTLIEQPVTLPDAPPITTNKLVFTQSFEVQTNLLRATSAFVVNGVEFSPAEYLILKQNLKDIEYARKMQPVFTSRSSGESDVEILLDETAVDLEDAQNWSETRHVRLRVRSYAGVKRFSELKLSYNPVWSEVKLLEAIVTSPDGRQLKIAPEEINIMDAPWVGAAPRYPPERIMVVSLPGVAVGSVIEYRVRKTRRDVPFFSMFKSFADFESVSSNALRVTVPPSVSLKVLDRTNGKVESSLREENGCRVYEWRVLRQSVLPKEDSLPPLWSFCPTVFLSTGEWQTYLSQLGAILSHAARAQPVASATARQITKGKRSTTEKIVVIRDFVVKRIRLAGPALTDLPLWTVSAADRTLRDGYGTATDRAVLLYTMLRAAGLRPEFVLTSSTASRDIAIEKPRYDSVQRSLFDELLVKVEADGKTIFLNDTDQYATLGTTLHEGKPAIRLDATALVIRAPPDQKDRIEERYEIGLADNGDARITVTRRYFGPQFAVFHKRFAELPPEERRRYFQELIAELSQAAIAEGEYVTDYKAYPGIESYTVFVPRFAVRTAQHCCISLPHHEGRFLALRADERRTPLYLSTPQQRVVTYELVLPPSARAIQVMPVSNEWQLPASAGRVRHVSRLYGKGMPVWRLEILREMNLASAVVTPDEYPALLAMIRRIYHPETRTILVFGSELPE